MNIENNGIKVNTPSVFKDIRKREPSINFNAEQDSINLYDMSSKMELTKGYIRGGHIYNGTINGKESEIKLVFMTDKDIELEGKIGDKKIILSGANNGKKNIGKYNGKDFDINIEFEDNKKMVVKKLYGTIDDKNIELDFTKQPDVPKDSDTRDIINTILFTNANMPFTINGKIAKIVMTEACEENVIYRREQKKEKINNYLIPALSTIGGSILTIISSVIMNKIENPNEKILKNMNLQKIFNKDNIKNTFNKINFKSLGNSLKKLIKIR